METKTIQRIKILSEMLFEEHENLMTSGQAKHRGSLLNLATEISKLLVQLKQETEVVKGQSNVQNKLEGEA